MVWGRDFRAIVPQENEWARDVTPETDKQRKPHRYLFLQGHPSAFSYQLGQKLRQRGAQVNHVRFCAGDWFYWRGRDVIRYRGRAHGWAAFLKETLQRLGITHIVYFADRLPYHVVAQKIARQLGIQCVSYEFGYLRPDWIIAERGGQSIYSHFPDDMSLVRKLAADVPEPDMTPRHGFKFPTEAFNEVLFNLANYFLWFSYPHYDTDKKYNPLVEYLGYVPRLIKGRFRRRASTDRILELAAGAAPYFAVGLQMQGDYQVQGNSRYQYLGDFIQDVITSFAANADAAALLAFKKHPLDNGLENWSKVIHRLAGDAGIRDRVFFIDGGNLNLLLKSAKGVVVINSTVGLHALRRGSPVKTMGFSVYDMEGLTHQGTLDSFWTSPVHPVAADVAAVVRLLAASIHVRGDFYSDQGRRVAVRELAEKLQNGTINGHGAFVDPPPRLAKAKRAGISVDY